MSVQQAEEWPSVFSQNVNAGNLEGALALYEPGAAFVRDSGEVIFGHEQFRPILAALISKQPRFESKVERSVVVGDTAILYTNFKVTIGDTAGKPTEMKSRAIEVLRRQADGTWKLIVGDPNGRANTQE